MNRRPDQTRTHYDAFSTPTSFRATTPGNRFFDAPKKSSLGRRVALFLFLSLSLLLSLNALSNAIVHVDRVTIPITGLHAEYDGYTILHISDLKGASFGHDQSQIAFTLRNQSFDAVLITGDMVSAFGNSDPLYALIDQLHALNPQAPIYFIAGDDDPTPLSAAYYSNGSPFAPWILGSIYRGAQYLYAPCTLEVGTQTLWLTTGDLMTLDLPAMHRQYAQQYEDALSRGRESDAEMALFNLNALDKIQTSRKAIRPTDILIALSHTTPTPEELTSPSYQDVDLVLSGHTLGGLIRLPLIGPIFIPSANLPNYGLFPGRTTQYGYSKQNGIRLYTSPGLGSANSHYPPFFFRLMNPPTISLLTLTMSSI